VFDSRHDSTYRLYQSITAVRYMNPFGMGIYFPSGEPHLARHDTLDPGLLRNSSGRAQSWQGGENAIAAKSGFGDAHFGNGDAAV
jgi:hypothetical protein